MSKGSRNKKNLLAFGFLKGRDKEYDAFSLSGEPLLQSEDSSFSTAEEHPGRHYGATAPDAVILPQSNSTCATTLSGEGAQLQTPSTTKHTPAVVLYDPDSMLELSPSLCQGYVTLLSYGKTSEQAKGGTNSDSNDKNNIKIELAYAAITDGNVVDVCFGIVSYSCASKATASTMQRIKDVKGIIDDLANSDFDHGDEIEVEGMVIQAYCTSFESIIQMHDRIKRLNFITKCFCYQRIRHQTLQSIRENFDTVHQKVALLLQYQSQQHE